MVTSGIPRDPDVVRAYRVHTHNLRLQDQHARTSRCTAAERRCPTGSRGGGKRCCTPGRRPWTGPAPLGSAPRTPRCRKHRTPPGPLRSAAAMSSRSWVSAASRRAAPARPLGPLGRIRCAGRAELEQSWAVQGQCALGDAARKVGVAGRATGAAPSGAERRERREQHYCQGWRGLSRLGGAGERREPLPMLASGGPRGRRPRRCSGAGGGGGVRLALAPHGASTSSWARSTAGASSEGGRGRCRWRSERRRCRWVALSLLPAGWWRPSESGEQNRAPKPAQPAQPAHARPLHRPARPARPHGPLRGDALGPRRSHPPYRQDGDHLA